jgi:hypothetical protein
VTRVAVAPYRTADLEAVVLGSWASGPAGSVQLGPELAGWDAATPLMAHRTVSADLSRISSQTGLATGTCVAIVTVWSSASTGLRGSSPAVEVDLVSGRWQGKTSIDVEGACLGGSVRLCTKVVLIERAAGSDRGAAQRVGTVLWSEPKEHRLIIEGGLTRFPVEVVAFPEKGNAFAKAGWMLEWDRADLTVPVSLALRLLINGAHERVVLAAKGDDSPESELIRSALYTDVARQLIMGALATDDFTDPEASFDDGSIGAILQRLMRVHFPGQSAVSLRSHLELDPNSLEAQIQSRTRLFRS